MNNEVEYNALRREKYVALIEQLIGMPICVNLLKKEDTQSLEEYLKEKIKGIIID